jgi:hypothetical protein
VTPVWWVKMLPSAPTYAGPEDAPQTWPMTQDWSCHCWMLNHYQHSLLQNMRVCSFVVHDPAAQLPSEHTLWGLSSWTLRSPCSLQSHITAFTNSFRPQWHWQIITVIDSAVEIRGYISVPAQNQSQGIYPTDTLWPI